jgi:hypothetical protein
MEDVGDEVRRLIPHANYLTDAADRPEGFFYPSTRQLAGWIRQASTGLALSQTGGTCMPVAQYLLCGTPVVSVPNLGGRDHFLAEPFAITAEPTAEAVAAAVTELKARNLSRDEVHEATRRMFVEARARFVDEVNGAMREEFGPGHRIDDVSALVGEACRYRRALDVIKGPEPPPVPVPVTEIAESAPAAPPAPEIPASAPVAPAVFLEVRPVPRRRTGLRWPSWLTFSR